MLGITDSNMQCLNMMKPSPTKNVENISRKSFSASEGGLSFVPSPKNSKAFPGVAYGKTE